MSRPLRIFTWHVHGSYLYYLAHVPHQFFVPVDDSGETGYCGRTRSYPWPENVIEVPTSEVRRMEFDCVLFQSHQHYLEDQFKILTERQRLLPTVFLEHDPPREHPTDTRHPVQNKDVLLVHVTAFNQLMWDCGPTPTQVVEHGVSYHELAGNRGWRERGITVVNNMRRRGRRLGHDLWDKARSEVPMDLVGMGWEEVGGIGEIRHAELPAFLSEYRFFFNPIRYTSLGLAVCEAMMAGLPIIGMATTEMVTVVPNGVAGFLDTRLDALLPIMQALQRDKDLARELGDGARRIASERFSLARFVADWLVVFSTVTATPCPPKPSVIHPHTLTLP